MSQRVERTIDIEFEVVDIDRIISQDVIENNRSIDVEITVVRDQTEVVESAFVIERDIRLSLSQVNLNVDLSEYMESTDSASVLIEKFIKGDRGDKAVVRAKKSEFDRMVAAGTLDKAAWYFVTNDYDYLTQIYAGDVLIAQSDAEGSFAFPYTFPITF